MGRTVYLPTLIQQKSTIHVGKYTVRPMDPMVNMKIVGAFIYPFFSDSGH